MFLVPEDVGTLQKTSFDAVLKFTDAFAQAGEQLFDLQVDSAKAGTAEAIKQVRALTGAKDVQELLSLQTSFSQANAEKALGFARAVYGWAAETQAEVGKLVDSQVSELNKSIAATLDKAAKAAPYGSEYAFAAVKQAVGSANQAYDALTKAGKQVVETTEATATSNANGIAPAMTKKKIA
jgi:phasin family protein